jgi:hypothetical protein
LEGHFVFGKLHGYGREVRTQGYSIGQWKNGFEHGEVKYYFKDGKLDENNSGTFHCYEGYNRYHIRTHDLKGTKLTRNGFFLVKHTENKQVHELFLEKCKMC